MLFSFSAAASASQKWPTNHHDQDKIEHESLILKKVIENILVIVFQ